MPDRPPAADGRRGAALVLVLILILALSSIIVADSAKTFRQTVDMRALAAEYQADLFVGPLLDMALERIVKDREFGYDLPGDPWTGTITDDRFRIEISPCNARLNLNGVADARVSEAVKALAKGRGMAASAASYLQDWIDKDADVELAAGSEGGAYARLWPRRIPRNAPLETPRELLLVYGWAATDPLWLDRTFTAWGEGAKLNINFADKDVFKAMFPEAASHWGKILAWRKEKGGFKDKTQLLQAVPELAEGETYYAIDDYIAVKSECFRVVIEVRLPFIYEKRRFIVKRSPFQPLKPEVVRSEILNIHPVLDNLPQ